MKTSSLQRVRHRIQRLITKPTSELRRGQRAFRYGCDLSVLAARTMWQRGVAMTAAALTYRTVFAIIPTAILVLIVFRAFLTYETAEGIVRDNAYNLLNINALTQGMSGDEANALRATVDERITGFLQQAYHLDTGQLGVAGGVLLIWAVMTLIMTVEQSFNRIFEAPAGRPWHQRLVMYWTVITAGPLLLVLSIYLARQVGNELTEVPGLGWLLSLLGGLSGLAVTWLLLGLLYRVVPTVQVKLRPALIGSLVAAILWQLGQWGFGLYASRAVGYSKVYGTLSLLPLGLIWIQFSWLVVLFGLYLTYALQHVRNYQRRQQRADENDLAVIDPLWVPRIMVELARRFESGSAAHRETLADALELPVTLITHIAERLEQADLIHKVHEGGEDSGGYALSRPPANIQLTELLAIGQGLRPSDETPAPRDPIETMRQAQRDAAKDMTLADALEASGSHALEE